MGDNGEKYHSAISEKFAAEAFSKAGFKTDSAICEIIDNSIEANAKNIEVRFVLKEKALTEYKRRVGKLVFIDDGNGMDHDQIFNYFIAGESTKRENISGIGKFGVGAHMACISQGNLGEVYSKVPGGQWKYVKLVPGRGITEPIKNDPPSEYKIHDKGTIVVWSDLTGKLLKRNDIIRKEKTAEKDVDVDEPEHEEPLFDNLGRIYRKFIADKKVIPAKDGSKVVKNDNKIKMMLKIGDDEAIEITPYDPLFITTPQDEEPKIHSQRVKLTNEGRTGFMIITYSYYPESWWLDPYKPGLDHTNRYVRRITERNQGISLVREGRELYYGNWPGGPIKIYGANKSKSNNSNFDRVDRWTGIEVEFTRESDDIFGVEFNKTRIHMEPFIRKEISKAISKTVVKRRNDFSTKRKEKKTTVKGPQIRAGGTPQIQKHMPKKDYDGDTRKKLREFAERFKASTEDTDKVLDDLLKGYHVTLNYELDPKGPHVSYEAEASSVLMIYNMRHPFMVDLFDIMDKAEGTNYQDEMDKMRKYIEILLAAYGFTVNEISDPTQEQEIQTTIDHLMANWGLAASRLSSKQSDE